ncbi:MAG: 3,4-dihydroxy-2-butanone-4-phosphate synthase [Candidatus Micrarchaeia archaeon]
MRSTILQKAIGALGKGEPVLIFDSEKREGETDIVIGSEFVTPHSIRMMRKEGGGLICITMPYTAASALGLDYLLNIYKRSRMPFVKSLYPNDIPYGEKSSFSITINHRKTFTGIPDVDRALTISEFSKIVKKAVLQGGKPSTQLRKDFGRNFRSPGHVFTLIAAKGLLSSRKGHTELSTYLAYKAGITPSATIVEMLGDDGHSLSKKDAIRYAKRKGFVFIEGSEIIKDFVLHGK